MKLITRTNMSCPNLDIHKSKENVVITHESKMEIIYCSMVSTTNERMVLNHLLVVWKHNLEILTHGLDILGGMVKMHGTKIAPR
jgi:hypothetical protein